MPSLKARVLLGLLLSAGADRRQVAHAFALLGSPRRRSSPAADTFQVRPTGGPAGTREGAREP
jgi:hypothetical protein